MCKPTDILSPVYQDNMMQQVHGHTDTSWLNNRSAMFQDSLPTSDLSHFTAQAFTNQWQAVNDRNRNAYVSTVAPQESYPPPSLGVPISVPAYASPLQQLQGMMQLQGKYAHAEGQHEICLPPMADDDFLPSSPSANPCNLNGPGTDVKKYKRMMSNRASAKRSRKRRQERLEELEITSAELQVENATTERKLLDMEAEARQLREENERLQREIKRLRTRKESSSGGSHSHSHLHLRGTPASSSHADCLPAAATPAAPSPAPLAAAPSAATIRPTALPSKQLRPMTIPLSALPKREQVHVSSEEEDEEEPILLDTPPRGGEQEDLSGSEEEGLLQHHIQWMGPCASS